MSQEAIICAANDLEVPGTNTLHSVHVYTDIKQVTSGLCNN